MFIPRVMKTIIGSKWVTDTGFWDVLPSLKSWANGVAAPGSGVQTTKWAPKIV
jgi:hypothetical protein